MTASKDASPPYTLAEHRHRYACWCAGRAAGRGLAGGVHAVFRSALEASALPALLGGPSEAWPATAAEFDAAHQAWCGDALSALRARGVADATFGRAAKLVAIDLKTLVVCGGGDESALAAVAHPPIDRQLLQALQRDLRFSTGVRARWGAVRWTALDAAGYAAVVASFRSEGLEAGGFWRVERWWVPEGGG